MENIMDDVSKYVHYTIGQALEHKTSISNTLEAWRSPIASFEYYIEPAAVLICVVLFIIAIICGSRLALDFDLVVIRVLYHGCGALLSFVILQKLLQYATYSNYKIICNGQPSSSDVFSRQVAEIYGLYVLLKCFDFFSLVFRVMAGKPVSPARCFFSIMNLLFAWAVSFHAPFGDAYLPVAVDSVVSLVLHIVAVVHHSDFPCKIFSLRRWVRLLSFAQSFINIAAVAWHFTNECNYPVLISWPFAAYNFLFLIYGSLTNTHIKQD